MKAVRIHQHGPIENLLFEDVPTPEPKSSEVLVRVRGCALNHLDIWVRQGLPGVKIPLPHIPGCDVAGEIESIGSHVKSHEKGEKVIIAPGVSCGKCFQCANAFDSACDDYDIIGYRRDGGYAEYVAIPERNVFPLPSHLSFEESASIPLVFLTAWHMLVTRCNIRPGETVLVLGAGSGVGIAAIQIAKLFNAHVIATAGSAEKLDKAKQLGADNVINHTTQDIVEEVRKITDRKGVDIVFEHIGAATWDKSLRVLGKRGRLVTCGATTGSSVNFDLRFLFTRQLSILGSYMGSLSEFIEVLKFVNQKKLRPVVAKTFALKDAQEAHRLMESRDFFGKIVLKI